MFLVFSDNYIWIAECYLEILGNEVLEELGKMYVR